mmetsp:Transcript_52721/g.118291  ORF Transcript_52721/g.118291 Transcript_52721/m.118291 type:complete len:326 (+) Transcript_52721:1-978(+)
MKRKRLARDVARVDSAPDSAMEAFSKMQTSQAVMTSVLDSQHLITPVSWVNQASFEPLGLTIAVPKSEEEQDETVVSDPEAELEELLKSHESVRSRVLEEDEVREILLKLFGQGSEQQISQALDVLDPDSIGLVTFDELRVSMRPGESVRALIEEVRAPKTPKAGDGRIVSDFVLSLMPHGHSNLEVAGKASAHKKAEAKNGCMVMENSHAFMECQTNSVLDAGNSWLLYAVVKSGKVLDEKAKTHMASPDLLHLKAPVHTSLTRQVPVAPVAPVALMRVQNPRIAARQVRRRCKKHRQGQPQRKTKKQTTLPFCRQPRKRNQTT